MITAKNYSVLASITPKKVMDAIASGKAVRIEEVHIDTRCKTHYHRLAEIDGIAYNMSAAGFNKVYKTMRGESYFEMLSCGGLEGYAYNC